MKNQKARIVFKGLLYPALPVAVAVFFSRRMDNHDLADILQWLLVALALGAIIVWLADRFFPGLFDNKPTREEMDRRIHGG